MPDDQRLVAALRDSGPNLSAGIGAVAADERPVALALLARQRAPMVHVDVTGEGFAGRRAGSPRMVAGLRTPLLKDVHLMVEDPIAEIGRYAAAGADAITVHVETRNPARALAEIGRRRAAADPGRRLLRGLAIWPETPIARLKELIEQVDLALVLGVSLADQDVDTFGLGLARVRELARTATRPLIAFDGGVTPENAAEVAASGCDVVVSGSGIFGASDPAAALARTLARLSSARRAGEA